MDSVPACQSRAPASRAAGKAPKNAASALASQRRVSAAPGQKCGPAPKAMFPGGGPQGSCAAAISDGRTIVPLASARPDRRVCASTIRGSATGNIVRWLSRYPATEAQVRSPRRQAATTCGRLASSVMAVASTGRTAPKPLLTVAMTCVTWLALNPCSASIICDVKAPSGWARLAATMRS